MGRIETGVDKLVDLVNRKKKITVEQAADELGVSTLIIQEWADFLEEEGIISVEYSLSKVYLTEKKLSKKEVEKKAKDYENQKDAFIRKVETAVHTLNIETSDFERIRKEFMKLKSSLGGEMERIHDQLNEIKHYESLKQNMDQEIVKQRQEYEKVLGSVSKEIKEEVKKYDQIIREIERESTKLEKEKSDIKLMEKQEDLAKQKLKDLNKALELIGHRIETEKTSIESAEKKINSLQKLSSEITKEIKQKTDTIIAPLIKLSEQHKSKIVRAQDDIMAGIKKRSKEIEGLSKHGYEVSERFSAFFDEKSNIEKLFDQIEKEKSGLEKEMEELIEAARNFNIASNKTEIKKHVAELMKKFKDIDKRKQKMHTSMTKLSRMIKSK